ncbi:MAG: hypothetical protein CML22_07205 [Rheinheimera sp.]|nr:hypothetical protein [Rheinheimera sp.]MBM34071.1 hypothetical protein [Rheinheimera sp.]|tara:strand:- start:1786 stop:2445 length:660 start_codon:yes stop_codon:yes gene_type:complete
MKALFDAMKKIAESSPAPLFTGFKDDLYKHDKDQVKNDMQSGDVWLWCVKQCGTYLALANKNCDYVKQLLSPTTAPERRNFLIFIHSTDDERFSIKEYTLEELAVAITRVSLNPNRKALRRFGYDVITGLEPMFKGSILLSDFTMDKGAVLYLSLNNNSASYLTSTGKGRTVGLPFSFERKTGAYKVTITSEFGHAVIEKIKMGVFTRAQKRLLSQKAA